MVLKHFDHYQNYMKRRNNLRGSIGLHGQSPDFANPSANVFTDQINPNFPGGALKVLDRSSKFGTKPVQRPMQPNQYQQVQAMFDMHRRKSPQPPWPGHQPFMGMGMGMGPQMGFAPPMDPLFAAPFPNSRAEMGRHHNYFMGNRVGRGFGGGGPGTGHSGASQKGIQDDAGIENSEMDTRVSELEKMIDMIEKANTQISSLISQSQLEMSFGKKVSMCSANPNTAKQKQKQATRITRSADLSANARKIQALKKRFETLTKKTMNQLNEVVPGEKGSSLENQAHAGYSYVSGQSAQNLRQMEKLQKKVDELSQKRTRDMDKLKQKYLDNCDNMEKDFRGLFTKMSSRNKELEKRLGELEKQREEGLARIRALIQAKKQKEVMIEQISGTLLLSKKEVEGIGQKAKAVSQECEDRRKKAEREKEELAQETEKLRQEVADTRDKMMAQKTRADQLQKKLEDTVQQMEEVRVQLKAKEAVLQDRVSQEERLKEEIQRHKERAGQSGQFEKEARRLERDNAKLRAKVSDVEKRTEKLRKKNQRQDELIDEYEKELTGKNEAVLGLNHELEETRREATQTRDRLGQQVRELRQCVAEMEQAVAESVHVE